MIHPLQNYLLPLDSTFSSLIKEKSETKRSIGVVCFLLINDNLVLIRRSDEMPTHRGQLGLIGGHKKSDESILEGALREFYEELSLKTTPEFFGFLPPVQTTLKNSIIPVVCKLSLHISHFLEVAKSNGEWVELFIVPLKEFYEKENWGYGLGHNSDQNDSKPIFFFPIKAYTYQSYLNKNDEYQTLWGATAQMVLDFVTRVPKKLFEEI